MDSPRAGASVLIVDHSEETREVLRTVLERRGVSIWEASRGEEGLEILRRQHPQVVVLDLEIAPGQEGAMQDAYADESRRQAASLVMLGRVRTPPGTDSQPRVISKPYHFGPLIHTIEQLLEHREASGAR